MSHSPSADPRPSKTGRRSPKTMTDPFATLGLPRRFDLDTGELEARYRDLQRALHPDRHVSGSASQRRLSLSKAIEVNEAYRALKDELSRAEALAALLAGQDAADAPSPEADPEFLMEVMELREGLGEAKAERDLDRVHKLADVVQAKRAEARRAVAEGFAAADSDRAALAAVREGIGRLKYYKRFLDEVAVIEDECL